MEIVNNLSYLLSRELVIFHCNYDMSQLNPHRPPPHPLHVYCNLHWDPPSYFFPFLFCSFFLFLFLTTASYFMKDQLHVTSTNSRFAKNQLCLFSLYFQLHNKLLLRIMGLPYCHSKKFVLLSNFILINASYSI